MKTLKKLLFAALATIGFSYGYADEVEHIPENLPANLVKIDYTESTGKQFIDTGLGRQNKLLVDFDLEWTAGGKYQWLMGYCNSGNTIKQYAIGLNTADNWRGGVNGKATNSTGHDAAKMDTRYSVQSLFDGENYTVVINGVSKTLTMDDSPTSSTSQTFRLFDYYPAASGLSKYPAYAKLYSCKVYTGATSLTSGTLARDYMPVYNVSNGKYGLYEWVEGSFKASATSTGFAGPTVVAKLTVADSSGEGYGTVSPAYGEVPDPSGDITFEILGDAVVQVDDTTRMHCVGWKLYNANGKLIDEGSDLSKTITFDWPTTAKFEWQWVKEYSVSVEADPSQGQVEGAGWYAVGSEVSLTAIGLNGYSFKSWSGEVVTEESAPANPLVFTMPDHATTVTATFAEPEEATIVVQSNTGTEYGKGSLDPDYGENKIRAVLGSAITFTCPEAVEIEEGRRVHCVGYKVFSLEDEVLDEGVPTVEDGVATVSVVYNQDFKLEWQWSEEYLVSVSGLGTWGTVTGDGWYANGAAVSVELTPTSENYRFAAWGGVPGGSETDNPVEFTMNDAPIKLTASHLSKVIAQTTGKGYTVAFEGETAAQSVEKFFAADDTVTISYGPTATATYTWEGLPQEAEIDEENRIASFIMADDTLSVTVDGNDIVNPDSGWLKTYTTNDVTYQVVAYTKTGVTHEFTVPYAVHELEYLVVGGGGSGGRYARCGGGGAGGLVTNVMTVAFGSTYTIKVGAGGAALPEGDGATSGNSGGDSSIELNDTPIVIAYGGGGGGTGSTNGKSGGSGGGAGGYYNTANLARSGGEATQPNSNYGGLGNKGGDVTSSTSKVTRGGGGGGGAGGPGTAGTSSAGAGGLGVMLTITGEEKWYAGGGGGGKDGSGAGIGGSGVGGNGGTSNGYPGVDGTGSGGGGSGNTGKYASGKGGDGVVILRYVLPISRTNVLVTTEDGTLYGAPTPDYGEYEVGAYTTFAAPEYATVDDTTRAYCLGWSALDKWGEPWIKFTPGCSATIADEVPFALVWRWEVRRQVAATATEGGSVTGLDYFASGAEVELKATAESGYRFVAWENVPDGAVQQVDGTLTFTMGEEAVTALKAVFEAAVSSGVVVTFEGGNYGSPSPDYGTYTDYADGVERTYTNDEFAEISEGVRAYCIGYKVLDSDGQQLAEGTETSFKWTCAAGSHHTIVWIWEIRYLVTATAGEGGSVTGTDYYAAGEEVATVTATAAGGYAFDGWTGDVPEGEENTNLLKLTVVDAPLAVSASFRQIPWGVALDYNKLNLADVEQVSTNREACAVGETYTFKVPILIEKTAGAERQRVIGYTVRTISEAGDGEETFYEGEVEDETNLVAAITYAEPVKVTWQWENDYYLTAGVNEGAMGSLVEDVSGWYTNNSEVTVAIKDAKYFLSWSGDIAKADRAESAVTLKITKASRATALFMTNNKDNVIANGDFEDMTGMDKIYTSFNSLKSGFWDGNVGEKNYYSGSGILTGSSGSEWSAGRIAGKATAWLGNAGTSNNNSIWTDFTVYERGEYLLSYQVTRERTDGYAATSYDVTVVLCDASGNETELDTVKISGSTLYTQAPETGVRLQKGKYRLKFKTSNPVAGKNGSQMVLAVDNVSLKLKQSQGLSIMLY